MNVFSTPVYDVCFYSFEFSATHKDSVVASNVWATVR